MHPLYEQYQQSLLGRLKANALIRLSGSEDRFPSERERFREVFKRWKKNPIAGRFYLRLLQCSKVDRLKFPLEMSAKEVRSTLNGLKRAEYFDNIYAEGCFSRQEGPSEIGCIILGHRRINGEPGYYATVYGSDNPDVCGFCSLVPPGVKGDGHIRILAPKGWKNISPNEVKRFVQVRVVLSVLRQQLDDIQVKTLPIAQIRSSDRFTPPGEDPELMRRLHATYSGAMDVTLATVSLEYIVAEDVDFCLRFPTKNLQMSVERIQRGYRPTLLVYWSGAQFIMSDDYFAYLAYRQAVQKEVSVAILGEFPSSSVASVHQRGGAELLPPVGIAAPKSFLAAPASAELKQFQLKEKLHSKGSRNIPADLIAAWFVFAERVGDDESDESDLHEFITRHPEILTMYGTRVEPEVRLGNEYRVDLVVRSSGIRGEVTLVELEHHRHGIFTRSGRPRSQITHAIQQVQDWMRWIREHPSEPFSESMRGIPPKGLVVAGRSRDFTEDHRDRLAHLNSTSPVPVITYDELLDRLADVILNRLSNAED